MRGLLVVLVALVAGCDHHEQVTAVPSGSTEADFAAQLAAALPGHRLAFDAAQHQLTGSDEVIFTTNMFHEWEQLPVADRAAEVRRFAAGFLENKNLEKPKNAAAVKSTLRPVVRAASYFDPAQLKKLKVGSAAADTVIPFVPLGDGAAVGVAIDGAASMSVATNKDLAAWHMTIEQAIAIAVTNLRGDSAHLEEIEPGVWTAQMHDSYDASRIVLVDDIARLGLAGGAVALIPNRETLLLAGRNDARALLAIARRAEPLAKDPRPIHTQALCLVSGAWHDCIPDVTAEVKHLYRELAAHGWIELYGDDHDGYQDQLGDDLFVAHLSGMAKQGGAVTTYATWTRTVPSMLPKADYIAFVVLEGPEGSEKGHVIGMAPWDRVMSVLGSHLKETGHMPRYWATGDYYPTAQELTKLALVQNP